MAAVVHDRNSGVESLERFEVIRPQIGQRRKVIRERKRIEAILRAVIEVGFILILLLSAYSLGFTNASSKQIVSPHSVASSSNYLFPSSGNTSH